MLFSRTRWPKNFSFLFWIIFINSLLVFALLVTSSFTASSGHGIFNMRRYSHISAASMRLCIARHTFHVFVTALRYVFLPFVVVNGLPEEDKISPTNCGVGGREVKETVSGSSIPNENSGKPDPGTPGGPPTPDSGEGGKGGATGDKPKGDGGTDVATCGGAKGTNVEPVGPSKPVLKPVNPKPSPFAGGPGTTGTEEEVIISFQSRSLSRYCRIF